MDYQKITGVWAEPELMRLCMQRTSTRIESMADNDPDKQLEKMILKRIEAAYRSQYEPQT